MRKSTIALTCGMAGLIVALLLSNATSAAATTSYGEDRAQIEDLQARYLFALDFHDQLQRGSAKWQYKGGVESPLVERFFGLGG